MASEASWQTGIDVEPDGAVSDGQRAGLDAPWTKSSYQPLGQHTIESLLQRLVDRFEESERLYGEAIEDLHSRLDQLSQTTHAARQAPEDVDDFDRLQTEVRDLAHRLGTEASTPLENFERLGRALTGGLRADGDDRPDGFNATPEPSPFAKSLMASKPGSRLMPDLEEEFEPPALASASARYAPPSAVDGPRPDFDRQLVAMADRLERSIETAMPTGTIEALNVRLDLIAHNVAQACDAGAGRSALEHVENHIADMGRKLAHAEAQLGRIVGVEEHLRKLIVRLDQTDTTADPASIAPEQAQDIAAKAAEGAAQRVADNTKQTAERLDALQRELTAIGQTSRLSADKVVDTLAAVNETLNRLARHAGRPPSTSPAARPSFATDEAVKPPFAQARPDNAAPASPDTPSQSAGTGTTQRANGRSAETSGNANAAHGRDHARTVVPVFKGAAPAATAKASDEERLNAAPDDLVAAARQAAQAAAARAEERAEQRLKRTPVSTGTNAPSANRWRPLLIVIAAGLLVISALLLYGRLGSKAEPGQPPAQGTSAVPGAPVTPGVEAQPPSNQAPSNGPAARELPQPQPKAGSTPANGTTGRTEVGAVSDPRSPTLTDRLASGVPLPPGVTFSGSY